MPERNKIFVSYSHLDKTPFEEFQTMMAPAIRKGLVDLWHDQRIAPGAQWAEEIQAALASARIAVLLVSQNFLASHFIAKEELPPLLQAAKEEGVIIFWIYLSPCLYEQTEIGSYQAAHDLAKPLSQLSKAKRQALLSEICAKLIRVAGTAPPTPAGTGSGKSGVPVGVRPDKRTKCALLLIEALDQASGAASGGGPTTAIHRRLDIAQKWLGQGAELLAECQSGFSPWLTGELQRLVKPVLPLLISEARLALPPAGNTDTQTRASDYFKEAREGANNLLQSINQVLDANQELRELRDTERKWPVLGFRDRADFDDYLFPPVKRLLETTDPMQRDLFERLLEAATFTPRQLTERGYRKDLVMDTVNALMKEKWAEWTDLSKLGSDGIGRVTEVGKRLLRQTLDLGGRRRPHNAEPPAGSPQ